MNRKLTRWLISAVLACPMLAPAAAHAAGEPTTAAAAVPPVEPAAVRRFALVIGSNHALDRKQSQLRYADDDAAKLADALRQAEVDVTLLVRLDHESQARNPELAGTTAAPTRANLHAQWQGLRDRMSAAKADGHPVELLLFYSGHGDVGPDGQGYLTLDDGKLTRADLFGTLLATSPAQFNHVLIDACRSEQFVLSRGRGRWRGDQADGSYGEAVKRYLDAHHLGAFPNTGVILAHSVDQQTHEWERYHGGIFTHELVSGLRGGADLNGDGHIEYSELGAFVSAANSSVDDPRARLQVVVRPPAEDERHAMLVHRDLMGSRMLLLTGDGADLWTLEDDHGIRIADVRRSGERPGYLRLPEGEIFVARERPGDEGTVHEEGRIGAAQTGIILASMLEFGAPTRQGRGAIDESLRAGLFATPFGPGYYAGFVDRTGLLPVRESDAPPVWATALAPAEPPPAASGKSAPPVVDAAARKAETATSEDEDDEREPWGSISLGTIVTPFAQGTPIHTDGLKRVTANGFGGPRRAAAFRGMDLRWNFTSLRAHDRYPRWVGYFRSGYTAGAADFVSTDTRAGTATSLSYVTIPLFVGGSFYPFHNFPLRPFMGMGAGVDILRVDYARRASNRLRDVSARIGFELHAGLELRITNYVAITAEVQQLWSARRRLKGVPDFSNEGFTIITGIAAGFPLQKTKPSRAHQRGRRR